MSMKRILSAALAMGLLMQSAACMAEATEPALVYAEATPEVMQAAVEAELTQEAPELPMATPEATAEVLPIETPALSMEPELPIETSAPSMEPVLPVETPAPEDAGVEPTLLPSEAPDMEPTAAPEDGLIQASSREEIPEAAQAWLREDDAYLCGSLADIVAHAQSGAEVYIRRAEAMELKAVSLQGLAMLKLLPDEAAFAVGEHRVMVSKDDPSAVENPVELDLAAWLAPAADEAADVFVWVVRQADEPAPEATQEPDAVKIEVSCDDCRLGEWSGVYPEFKLSGIPEGKNWVYAAVIYDERIAVLSGDSYLAAEEGVYTLRFVILDELGDIMDASEKYTLWLDHTPPEAMVWLDDAQDYTLHIDMTDGMSGLRGLTLDGGESWIELSGAESESYSYTASGKQRIEAGMLQVRDGAGNLWISTEDYVLAKQPSGGSGGGSSGDSKPVKQHAPEESSEESGAEYSALAMSLPDEPMQVLTIDGQELELRLELASCEGFEIPEDYVPSFTAELATWAADEDSAQPAADEQRLDTLVLRAVMEENMGDRFEYRWRFNGEVYRLLANSGVRYLALEVGGEMAVFPTEGFVGGTKYTQLKMLGVSTRRFNYTAAMSFNLDPNSIPKLSGCDRSEKCDLAMLAEVEDVRYVLSDEQKGEMYYCDVYLGPTEMMELPYGSYGA